MTVARVCPRKAAGRMSSPGRGGHTQPFFFYALSLAMLNETLLGSLLFPISRDRDRHPADMIPPWRLVEGFDANGTVSTGC